MLMGLFIVLAGVALLGGLGMVLSRRGVDAAMLMMLSFGSTAGLFVLLEAYVLAALQLLVYAGAIVVLFLFIIMLLDAKEAAGGSKTVWKRAGSLFCGAILLCGSAWIFMQFQKTAQPPSLAEAPALAATAQGFSTAPKAFGFFLLTKYLLPMQCAGFLLLTAVVGVIHLRQPKALE